MKEQIGNTANLDCTKDSKLQLHQFRRRLTDGQKIDKTGDLEGITGTRLQLQHVCQRLKNNVVQGTVPATAMVLQSALLLQARLVIAQAAS